MSSHHNFLSKCTYPSQSVGESVIDSFRLEIAIASLSLFKKSFKLSNSNTQTQIILYHILSNRCPFVLALQATLNSQKRNTFAKNLPEKDLCFFRTRLAGRCPHFILKLAILLLQAQL